MVYFINQRSQHWHLLFAGTLAALLCLVSATLARHGGPWFHLWGVHARNALGVLAIPLLIVGRRVLRSDLPPATEIESLVRRTWWVLLAYCAILLTGNIAAYVGLHLLRNTIK